LHFGFRFDDISSYLKVWAFLLSISLYGPISMVTWKQIIPQIAGGIYCHTNFSWKYIASIRLPPSLRFIDYSGIDINDKNIVAITSQESSAVWTGELDFENWKIEDLGHVYKFPKDKNGNMIYCNIEGVSWITNDRLVVVSDDKTDNNGQPEECHEKEQSIHIISINSPNI